MERTFLMVKPDGVQRSLIGEIVKRFEQKGFQLVGAKFMMISKEQAETHYAEHKEKPFFGELVSFITAAPVFAMVWEGDNVITLSRTVIGKTNPLDAVPGTIRGDFAAHTQMNLIHGSDSPDSAAREIANFFKADELVEYKRAVQQWI